MFTTIKRTDHKRANSEVATGSLDRVCIASFLTELGWMAVAWQDEVLVGNSFGHASRRSAELVIARTPGLPEAFCRFDVEGQADELPPWVADVVDRLQRFAIGESAEFNDVPLALDHLTPFGRRVIAACRRISWGQNRTYGELAIECGSAGAARAVGSVMAKNRYPLIVPCHRVLAAGGELGGYSAPEGLTMKRRLLEMENAMWPRRAK